MYFKIAYQMRNVFIIMLFAALFTACASDNTSNFVRTPDAPTPIPTPASIATTVTPTPSSSVTFKQFTGNGLMLQYPASWQQQQSTSTSQQTVYSFVAADSISGFHVELHAAYFDADSSIVDLFGKNIDSNMNCKPGDTSLPPTVMVNSKVWNQSDILCSMPDGQYEIRMLSNGLHVTDQTYIAYGAYKTASDGSQDFATMSKDVFDPMVQSFQIV